MEPRRSAVRPGWPGETFWLLNVPTSALLTTTFTPALVPNACQLWSADVSTLTWPIMPAERDGVCLVLPPVAPGHGRGCRLTGGHVSQSGSFPGTAAVSHRARVSLLPGAARLRPSHRRRHQAPPPTRTSRPHRLD